jgi:predicted aspartyl protease
MGYFMEEITLENVIDRGLANRGYIKEAEVRSLTVQAMPDTGAWTLVINEEIRQKLGLDIEGSSNSTLGVCCASRIK